MMFSSKTSLIVVAAITYIGEARGMVAKYSVLKFVAVAGTIFSIYNACAEYLFIEDMALIGLIAAAIVAIDAENRTSNQRAKARTAEELGKKLEALDEIGEIVHRRLEKTATH